jgi:hypothetical protein
MNWPEVLASSGVTTVAVSALAYLSRRWLSVRLNEGIADEYRRALEKFKDSLQWDTRRREQAAKVAEVFSLWLAAGYSPSRSANEIRYELQRRYWELSLWLDASVLREVNAVLVAPGAPGLRHKAALIAIRKLLVAANDDVQPEELVHWDAIAAAAGTPSPTPATT